MKRLYPLSLLLFLILLNFGLSAQNCIPSDQLPGPVVCLQQVPAIQGNTGYYSADLIPEGFCGTIENNGWFRFIACESQMSFNVVSMDCASKLGVQALVLDKNLQVVSNCYSPGTMGSGAVTASNLVLGEVYYFMVDGYAGDQCAFVVSIQNSNPNTTEIPGKITGPQTSCVGETVTYELEVPVCQDNCIIESDQISIDTTFIWIVPPGGRIIEQQNRSVKIKWDRASTATQLAVQMLLSSNADFCGTPGCSSCPNQILPLPIEVNPTINTNIPFVTICEGECFELAGEMYCETGHYEINFSTVKNCDSTVHLNLLVLQDIENYQGLKEICEGDCYTLNGKEYCQSGRYEQVFSAKNGCDSVVIFDLNVLNKSNHTLEKQRLCNGECIEVNDENYCKSGTFTQILTNSNGCDSVLTVNVQVMEPVNTILPLIEKCEGDCTVFNGQQICASGVYKATLINKYGCDSLVTQQYLYRDHDETDLGTQYLCKEDCFQIGGVDYCEDGSFVLKLKNQFGCDSVVQFDIKKVNLDFSLNLPDFLSNNDSVQLEVLQNSFPSDVILTWEFEGDVISTDLDQIDVSKPGIYQLTVEHPKVNCSISKRVEVFEWNLECVSESVEFFSSSCLETEFICGQELNGFCGDLSSQKANKPGNLQEVIDAQIENNIWFKWSPCADTARLRIATYDCTNQRGLEFSVLQSDNCEVFHSVINSKLLNHMKVVELAIPNLKIGEYYFMMFDGIEGDNCGFQIELVEGFQKEALEVVQLFPSRISGMNKVCADEIIKLQLELPQLAFRTDECIPNDIKPKARISTVKWHLPSNAQIHGDSTSSNLNISFNEQKYQDTSIPGPGEQIIGYENIWAEVKMEVDLEASIICGLKDVVVTVEPKVIQIKREVEHLPLVELCEGEVFDFCGTSIKNDSILICEEGCLTKVQQVTFKSPEITNHGEIEICPGTCYTFPITGWEVCDEGYHAKDVLNSCGGYESAIIKFRDVIPVSTGPRTEICDVLNDNYVVSFEIVEGIPPFVVEGQPITGNRFVSAPIPSGEYYNFKIIDSDVCENNLEVKGLYECSPLCPSVAGSMDQTLIQICENDIARGKYNGDGSLAAGDKFDYVLHNSAEENLGTLHGRNTMGEFRFDKQSMDYNKKYYISYVVGPEMNGTVDLSSECLSISRGQPVIFKMQPEISAGEDSTLDCEKGEIRLAGKNFDLNGDFNYEWFSHEGYSIIDKNTLNPLVVENTIYYLKATNRTTGCSNIDSVRVSKIENIPHTAEIDFEPPSCFGFNDGKIEVLDVHGGTPPYLYSLDAADFASYYQFDFLRSGTYELIIKDANNCLFSQLLTIYEPQQVEVDLGDDLFIGLGDQIELKAASSINPYRIHWTNDMGEEHLNESTWNVTPTHSMEYRVKIEDRKGCIAEDEVKIYVRDVDVYIPSAFSPNGDKMNDRFSIYVGDNVRRVVSFMVFDRGGQKVFEEHSYEPSNDGTIGWDGNYRSKPAPSNVYAYMVEVEYINGDVKVYNGDVTLLR